MPTTVHTTAQQPSGRYSAWKLMFLPGQRRILQLGARDCSADRQGLALRHLSSAKAVLLHVCVDTEEERVREFSLRYSGSNA